MNIIVWLNENSDAGEAILYGFAAFAVWLVLWHLIVKRLFKKFSWCHDLCDMGSLLGPLAAFGVLLMLALIAVLLVASVQAVSEYGGKMIFALLVFWGGLIAFFTLLIRHIKK